VLGPIEDLLRDGTARLTERVREQLELAHRNARRVLALIVEILDVNRLEHGKLAFRRERTGLALLVRRALEAEQALVERHGHTLELVEQPGAALDADVDPTQIERCLSNLVGNAAKYMARGGRIEVRLERCEHAARISVRDHGRGIGAAALPHVFDRFFQTEGGDEASGYGVGLALVREIVEGHGGRVAVESELAVGSTFTLELPLAAEPVASPSAAATAVPAAAEPERIHAEVGASLRRSANARW
jgi:signal transduction histidine kinase